MITNMQKVYSDTIAAIATAMSDSGIGIIRISGDNAFEVIDKIYQSKGGNKKLSLENTHTIHYGFIINEEKEIVDEVMVSIMKAPKSYTMENTVEINCHGGIYMMNRILEIVLANGARMAEPGEFTKRAFLNGRIDLSKAEAVIDIIHSKNEFALKSSVKQLKGSVSDKIKDLRERILYEIAFIESALDDPEHISLDGYHEELTVKNDNILKELKHLLDTADNGRILKDGINTVIVGKPNAGKSSLLNRLLGEEKAIVTNVAGTTRDALEENIRLNGISLNIIDTAGIRETEDIVEKIGVDKAKKLAKDADLIVYVVDASIPLDKSDKEIIKLISDKKVIILLNKSDLNQVVNEDIIIEEFQKEETDISEKVIIKTSTKENIGIDDFEKSISDMFFKGEIVSNDELYITNMRHKQEIKKAYESLLQVKNSLELSMPEDFYSIDLMSAYKSLGIIIGEEVEDDLVNEIFSKFCMGK